MSHVPVEGMDCGRVPEVSMLTTTTIHHMWVLLVTDTTFHPKKASLKSFKM